MDARAPATTCHKQTAAPVPQRSAGRGRPARALTAECSEHGGAGYDLPREAPQVPASAPCGCSAAAGAAAGARARLARGWLDLAVRICILLSSCHAPGLLPLRSPCCPRRGPMCATPTSGGARWPLARLAGLCSEHN